MKDIIKYKYARKIISQLRLAGDADGDEEINRSYQQHQTHYIEMDFVVVVYFTTLRVYQQVARDSDLISFRSERKKKLKKHTYRIILILFFFNSRKF